MSPAIRSSARYAAWTVAYLLAAVLGARWLGQPQMGTLFWPAAGVAFAACIVHGPRMALIAPLGLLVFHVGFSQAPAALAPWSIAGNTLAAFVGGWYARRAGELAFDVEGARRVLLAALLAATCSAAMASPGLVASGLVPLGQWPRRALLWAVGDLVGIVGIAPSLLGLAAVRSGRLAWATNRRRGIETLAWLALLLASLAGGYWLASRGLGYGLAITAIPTVVLVLGLPRFSLPAAALGTMAIVLAAGILIHLGLPGLPTPHALPDRLMALLVLLLLGAGPMLYAVSSSALGQTLASLDFRANHDALTQLLTRSSFEQAAKRVLERNDAPMSLLHVDLDDFKLVNNAASQRAGDALIRDVARLLAAEFPRDALVGRTAGDEFSVLAQGSAADVATRARRFVSRVESLRLEWKDRALSTTASVGIVTSEPPHEDYDALVSQADAACFAAKEFGGNRVLGTQPGAEAMPGRSEAMRSALRVRDALDRRQFRLHCQPIVPLRGEPPGRSHFEVLLRWIDEHGHDQPPAELIRAAEQYRLGPRLDRHVVEAVLRWFEDHPERLAQVASCSINLGAATLVDDEFADYLERRLQRSDVPPNLLCLEITETSAMRDLARARGFIARMKAIGCQFALDDFGTGFCSFGYLRDLEVDYLKIDGSFVRDIGQSELSEAVVRSIADIAYVMEKRTIAEHVETAAQSERLRELGVDFAQGYAYGKPQPIDSFFGRA